MKTLKSNQSRFYMFRIPSFLKKAFIFRLLLVLPLAGHAQEAKVWNLEDCIGYARSRNISVKKQLLNVQLRQESLTESKMGLLPSLNAGASHVYNWGQTIDPFTNQFASERVRSNNFYLQSQVVVFSGFQKLNNMRKNQVDLRISEVEVEKMMNDISLNVTTFYLQGLYYIEMQKNARSQLDVVRQQRDRIKILVEAGTLAQGELLNMEAQLAAAELQSIEADNNLELALLQLAQLIDLEDTRGFMIAVPAVSAPEENVSLSSPDQVLAYALKNQPEILASEYRVESAGKDLDIARGANSPTISLGGSWGTGYSGAAKEKDPNSATEIYTYPVGITQNSMDTVLAFGTRYDLRVKPFKDQLEANENKSFGIYLNIPVFNGLRTRTNINRAKLAVTNAELDLQLTRNNLRKLIVQSHADAQAALKRYFSATKKLAAQTESFHYASQKYAVGMLTAVEFNQNKDELNKAQSELLQAKYDFIFKTKILDFYEGKPLLIR